jgi:hypothetical protein
MKKLGSELYVTIDSYDIISALLNDLTVSELIEFIEEVDSQQDDWDLTNDLYEYFRQRHLEYLEKEGISEKQYRTEVADIGLYDEEDSWNDEEDEDEECWVAEDNSKDTDDDEDVDVFTT